MTGAAFSCRWPHLRVATSVVAAIRRRMPVGAPPPPVRRLAILAAIATAAAAVPTTAAPLQGSIRDVELPIRAALPGRGGVARVGRGASGAVMR